MMSFVVTHRFHIASVEFWSCSQEGQAWVRVNYVLLGGGRGGREGEGGREGGREKRICLWLFIAMHVHGAYNSKYLKTSQLQ